MTVGQSWVIAFLLLLVSGLVSANGVRVAVASNFFPVMNELVRVYSEQGGGDVKVSSASTGKLFAQIKNGAPYDVFFAADAARPERLVTEGVGDEKSLRTYAKGKLVFVSQITVGKDCMESLASARVKRIAIANPVTAPYGLAAQQTLEKLGYWTKLEARLVRGENIAQTLQYFDTGNAQAGFIAKSQMKSLQMSGESCSRDVPQGDYSPIEQKMVVLSRSAERPSVINFLKFLQSDRAAAIIKGYGYDI